MEKLGIDGGIEGMDEGEIDGMGGGIKEVQRNLWELVDKVENTIDYFKYK